jgi:hypothetical protein
LQKGLKNLGFSLASQVKAMAKTDGPRPPATLDAVAMLRVAMQDQAAFPLEASILHGKADPQFFASQVVPYTTLTFKLALWTNQRPNIRVGSRPWIIFSINI